MTIEREACVPDGPQAAVGVEVVEFLAPLPPSALRGNSRAHWTERKRAADEYSEAVWNTFLDTSCSDTFRRSFHNWHPHHNQDLPWKRAAVEYEWRYAGARPDLDNVARAVKVLQDTLCTAPIPTVGFSPDAAYRNRYFLGLIEDDGGIEPVTFSRKKVKTKAEEGVYVRIVRG